MAASIDKLTANAATEMEMRGMELARLATASRHSMAVFGNRCQKRATIFSPIQRAACSMPGHRNAAPRTMAKAAAYPNNGRLPTAFSLERTPASANKHDGNHNDLQRKRSAVSNRPALRIAITGGTREASRAGITAASNAKGNAVPNAKSQCPLSSGGAWAAVAT